ncbi:helix-turn-helix domain-containing protein [Saccharibacillus sp. CPCC 101409]|uniref:helix-turn-helix domain-containing protein n=1 Tax=Saccharibacillus sp. CPCC 101409 TaxID=3058041 RepID=UPI0026735EBE|nr:helix-turn-helix domain-containing protein [Saccharibacillus sp. CPCC 101409]MDO3411948.1 helix-turn-helix domain-containing protein [Saccharibacillus sp. CPCC 101409]
MLKNRLLRYTVYRNMFLSFVLLTAVIIALVTIVLYALFSWSTAREVGKISESMLKQNSVVANVIKDQVYNFGSLMLNDKTVVAALFDREDDLIKQYHASRVLRNMQTTYPFIESIGIYNGLTGTYLDTKGATLEQEQPLLKQIGAKNKSYFQLFPRRIVDPGNSRESSVLTFVLLPGYYALLPAQGAMVINMDTDYIQKLIGGYKNDTADSLFVLNSKGTVLTHSDSSQFMQNISSTPYVQRILDSQKSSGYFMDEIDGHKNVITYVKSADLDWIFVSHSEYRNLLFNMSALRWSSLCLALAIFAASLLLSVWLTNNAYNPIRGVLEKISAMQRHKQSSRRVNEFELLNVSYAEMTEKLSSLESVAARRQETEVLQLLKSGEPGAFERFVQNCPGPRYTTVALQIDGLDEFRAKVDAPTRAFAHDAILRAASELFGQHGARAAVIEEGLIALILPVPETAEPRDYMPLESLLQELQRSMRHTLRLSLTACIGKAERTHEGVRLSFERAQAGVQKRFFAGKGKVFDCADPAETVSGGRELVYPSKQEKLVIDAIRLRQRARINREIELLVKEMSTGDYHEALFCMNQFVSSLYKQLQVSRSENQEINNLFLAFTRRISSFETMQEFKEALKELADKLSIDREAGGAERHAEVVEFIKEYVGRHYARPDLSLELVAGEVKLSRSYVGKLFKAHCETSFNDYLNAVRLEKAKELLLRTDEPVQAISEQVGIFNTTYFYTLFKKYNQQSPAQYRSRMLLEKRKA